MPPAGDVAQVFAAPSCAVPLGKLQTLPACVKPGVLVLAGSGGAVVPQPGHGVAAEGVSADSEYHLTIITDPSGDVSVESEEGLLPPDGGGGPADCNDATFNLAADPHHIKWYNTMEWRIKTSSAPGYLAVADVVDKIREATSNITQLHNFCGIADNVSATSNYLGSTTQSVNMPNGTNNCADSGNGTSVVAFGDLAGTYIGWACWWWDVIPPDPDNITESDVRLNGSTSWTVTPLGSCSGDYSIEAVMTHERGHSFGIAHVNEADHGKLTMSTNINGTCQNSEASLGLGDIRGLQALY